MNSVWILIGGIGLLVAFLIWVKVYVDRMNREGWKK
jgi:hypothetical protein